jgi:pantetheine-phosphate adenylyltransferase
MKTAICPGSFDPITLGHLNIIRRAANIFDNVVVCIMVNPNKTSPMFTVEEKLDMARKATAKYKNVTVESYDGLLADYVKKFDGAVIIKGLRAASDFDYEFQMDIINKRLNCSMETMFLPSDQKYTFISSTIVREMARYGAELNGLVPDELIDFIKEKAEQWRK